MSLFKKAHLGTFLIPLFFISSCTVIETEYVFSDSKYEVKEKKFLLDFQKLEKQLPVRVSYPVGEGQFPIIVFSHGNGSEGSMYKGFTDKWASHGYVVIQPTHMDSSSLGFQMNRNSMREMYQQMLFVTDSRRQDMSFILDSLIEIEQLIPELKNKLNQDKIVAAGHSMGAATAMLVSGMTLVNPMDGYKETSDEKRFDALLMISDPTNMALMPPEPWKGVRVPTFISTGTNDFSDVGSGRMSAPFTYQIPENLLQSSSPHHFVLIEGADHYMGGLICRTDVPGPFQYEELRIASNMSVVFLDAYVKNNREALRSLRYGNLSVQTKGKASHSLR